MSMESKLLYWTPHFPRPICQRGKWQFGAHIFTAQFARSQLAIHENAGFVTDNWAHGIKRRFMYPWCIYAYMYMIIYLRTLTLASIILYIWALNLMHVCMMHISKILDPDTCTYVPWSLTLMHVCMMHFVILIHACIYDPWFMHVWCTNLWCSIFRWRTNQRRKKAILGVGYVLSLFAIQ